MILLKKTLETDFPEVGKSKEEKPRVESTGRWGE